RIQPGMAGQLAAVAAFCLAAGGVLCVAPTAQGRLALERLEGALPVHLDWLAPASGHGDLEAFRKAFNRGVNAAYRPLYPLIRAGQAVDNHSRIDGTALPNVIILVLESLRADAINPQDTPRLYRWAQKGLRFQRHYAGSNGSHLGIFGLLYGRTPLVYHLTV